MAKHKASKYLNGIMVVVAILLVIRAIGLYPTVFSDEYTYNKFSRLVSFTEANIPGYLYFFTYKFTGLCGDGFLECVRVLNVIFFVLAAPFIYFIGRKLTDEKTALLIATLSILGPINTYTAYFMPESLYFMCFWIFTYMLLDMEDRHKISSWLVLGIVFGITTLVKPHALFLMPVLLVYLWFDHQQFKKEQLKISLYSKYFTFFTTSLATKLMVGYILAGSTGITFFGQGYTSYASNSFTDLSHYYNLFKLAFENIQGHLLAISLLYSVAVAHLLVMPKFFFQRNLEQKNSINIALYTLLVLLVLLPIVTLFTASVSGLGQYESNARLHMRYYNFAFPLLLLAVASQLQLNSIKTSFISRVVVAVPIGAAICYALFTHISSFSVSLVDNPELRGFTFNKTVFFILGGMSLLSLAMWVYSARPGVKFFLYIFMPIAVGISAICVNHELRYNLVPNVYDEAGIFTKNFLPKEDIGKVLILGSDYASLYRSLFYLDNPKATFEAISDEAAYDINKFPVDKEWLLVIGDHSLNDNSLYKLALNDFSLLRVRNTNAIDFKKSSWPGVISNKSGLSNPETWGVWSEGNIVKLEFYLPLPEKFKINLRACAFSQNVGKNFVANVGESNVIFTLTEIDEERVLEFNNTQKSKIITINVPLPTSPKSIGLNDDERNLGIGLSMLRIIPAE